MDYSELCYAAAEGKGGAFECLYQEYQKGIPDAQYWFGYYILTYSDMSDYEGYAREILAGELLPNHPEYTCDVYGLYAYCYEIGRMSSVNPLITAKEVNFERAYNFYKLVLRSDENVFALEKLGEFNYVGLGRAVNYVEASNYYERALKLGSPKAAYYLGRIYSYYRVEVDDNNSYILYNFKDEIVTGKDIMLARLGVSYMKKCEQLGGYKDYLDCLYELYFFIKCNDELTVEEKMDFNRICDILGKN